MGTEKKKIIVAEDNKELCELLDIALTREGYQVDTVNDGFALVAYLKANQDVDAVILDLIMPDKGGISVFDTIRSISPLSKILIYTGHTDYRNSVYGRKSDAFIEKTEGAAKILSKLKELLY